MRVLRGILVCCALSAPLAGCGTDDVTGSQLPDLVGTWHATQAQVTSVAHPSTTMNLIAAGLSLQVVFAADHTYVSTTTLPGQPVDVSTGVYVQTATKLTMSPSQGSNGEVWVFDVTVTNGSVALTGATIGFDFGSGEESSKLDVTLSH